MTNPEGRAFDDEKSDSDVADQALPADAGDGDEETWAEADRISRRRGWEANEADLIDQAIVAPLPEDEHELD